MSCINIGNSLFTYQNNEFNYLETKNNDSINKNLENILNEIIHKTFSKANRRHGVKDSDIISIEIGNSNITYHLSHNRTISYAISKKLSKKISKLANGVLKIQRDIVGEKILELAKNSQFTGLYLYSSGGGGHKSAKEAEMERDFEKLMKHVKIAFEENQTLHVEVEITEQELEENCSFVNDERLNNPAKFSEWCKKMGLVKDIDVLHDFLGNVGKWASNQWDAAQREGDVKKQESLASKQWLSDLFFGPLIFLSTLRSLIQFKPKHVVSTQAMATPAILLALKLYNIFFKPKEDLEVKLNLYMTDMPTEYAKHFFDSLKKLRNMGGKDLLLLYTPKVDKGTDWEELCGLPKEQVKELDIHELPVRLDFLKAVQKYVPDIKHPSVEIKISEREELALLHQVLEYQRGEAPDLGDLNQKGVQLLEYSMKQEDKGCFIMLGSQPTKSAVEGYIQSYLKLATKNPENNYQVFIFAGKFEDNKSCFYKELCNYINKQSEWPPNLCVVPLSYQTPKQLVNLEMMCDTITRSGGSTAMELLTLNEINKKFQNLPKKQRLIHAEPVEGRSLEESIPLWERGNFFFLKDKIGARIVHPMILIE